MIDTDEMESQMPLDTGMFADFAVIKLIGAAVTFILRRLKHPQMLGYLIVEVIIRLCTPPFGCNVGAFSSLETS